MKVNRQVSMVSKLLNERFGHEFVLGESLENELDSDD